MKTEKKIYEGIIALSGGFDSTHVAYFTLKNNPSKKFLLLHVRLIDHERREPYEYRAVQNIIQQFKKEGITNFDLKECTYNKSTAAFTKNIISLGFFMGVELASRKQEINKIYFCGSADDFRQGPDFYDRYNKRFEIIKAITQQKDFTIVEPNRQKEREEVIKELPDAYKHLVWYCRKPSGGKACRKCATCKITLPFL